MLGVADVRAAVAWYESVGFTLTGSHGEDGRIDWAEVALGNARVMFVPSVDPWRGQTKGLSLWMVTDQLDELYANLKRRQLDRARAWLAGETTVEPDICFTADLYTAFYGQREFGVRDPSGVELMFSQPVT